jgi:hypothetical protein
MRWLKDAFAVDKAEDFQPTDEQKAIVDRLCRWLVQRGMATPALMGLEISRPLNYLGSQAMHFFRPAVAALLDTRQYELFAAFLEHRASIDYLCRRIEHFEAELAKPQAGSDDETTPDT